MRKKHDNTGQGFLDQFEFTFYEFFNFSLLYFAFNPSL